MKLSWSSVITSTSARQSGHQAKVALARRTTISLSVSTVILVVFTATARYLWSITLAYRFYQANHVPTPDQKSLKITSKFLSDPHSLFSKEKKALTGERSRAPALQISG
jgi:hypothetical protein